MDSLKLFFETDVSLDAIVPHKDAVLALAADRLADNAGMSYEHAKAALVGREKLGSTGLGQGVAMPHAMSRLCLRPAAALIGLSAPVNFHAPDDADVDVVFALIWPQDRAQEFLKLSSSISRILVDPAMLHLVRRSADADLIRRSIYFRAQADRSRATEAIDGDGGLIEFSSLSPGHVSDQAVPPRMVQGGANGS